MIRATRKVSSRKKDAENPIAIELRGGHSHNLKHVDVNIPLMALTVICGVSGSGKTSLALDTLYAEGQRRYIESFSPYTRQFLQRLDKPDFESLINLPAAIAVKRSGVPRSNRSTVGTTSEVDDYLRILYAKVATQYCPNCGRKIERFDSDSVDRWLRSLNDGRGMIAFQIVWTDAKDLAMQLANLQQAGFARLVVDGKTWNLSDVDRTELAKATKKHRTGFTVVDRISVGAATASYHASLDTAFQWGDGTASIFVDAQSMADASDPNALGEWTIDERIFIEARFSTERRCHHCDRVFAEADPRTFSFNSSLGACPQCEGLGEISEIDISKIVPKPNLSLKEGAIAPWNTPAYSHELGELSALAHDVGISLDERFDKLSAKALKVIWEGSPKHNFGGLNGFFAWLDKKKYKMHVRIFAARWRSYSICPRCNGERLNDEALAYKIAEMSISNIAQMSIDEALMWLSSIQWSETQAAIAKDSISQITSRLSYLQRVGLGYLELDRPLRTLSGGEATRVILTTCLGSDLVSMLYVLDEPTVGLHPADSQQLAETIVALKDRGNTVLVVEHEPTLLRAADWIVEVGPQAGKLGGQIEFSGPLEKLKVAKTLTAKYLFPKERKSAVSARTSETNSSKQKLRHLSLRKANGRNLKNIDLDIPLNKLVVVSGVSGSGKSSLVLDTIGAAVLKHFDKSTPSPLPYGSLTGLQYLDSCLIVDQEPISLSLRSNPATYSRVFDEIRKVFGALAAAKAQGLTNGHFSFNNEHGQCPRCEGDGLLSIDMQFLADIQTVCPECHGSRYRPQILEVKYRDRSVADCLAMTIEEANEFFRGQQKLQSKLQPLIELGLGYLPLGQAAPTLSAGEMQRLKLATYLVDASNRSTLFIMDEPTTGLHFFDVENLIFVLRKLVEAGHSIIVIEHNEQLLRAADHCIDLGPGPSKFGGEVVVSGSLDDLRQSPISVTGRYVT